MLHGRKRFIRFSVKIFFIIQAFFIFSFQSPAKIPHFSGVEYIFSQPSLASTVSSAENPSGLNQKTRNDDETPVKLSLLWIIPFAGMLLSIALIPLIKPEWWHHNFKWVSMFWGLPVFIVMSRIVPERTFHTAMEYLSFIALVGSLFVISGGILIRSSFASSTLTNAVFLAVGAGMASFIGTAGASMIMLRPLLRINSDRKVKIHIFVFFIFIVSNIGGSLTPLGDPPLFLGFLQGVPFHWPFLHLIPLWALNISLLLIMFSIIDYLITKGEKSPPPIEKGDDFNVLGSINFLFLAGVVAVVIAYGSFLPKSWGLLREAIQIIFMVLLALLSLKMTKKEIREENGFSWFPVKEVAILFAGIFASMIPALDILQYLGETGKIAVNHPWQFFWMSGVLSSFLDNAPTYMTFLSLGKTLGITASGVCNGINVIGGCIPQNILLAISAGSVFMGANTYIGNAPNFMVKSICEENSVKMPSFFGYMAWSICILIPLFILNTFIFFR